jgi:hypothetical protein
VRHPKAGAGSAGRGTPTAVADRTGPMARDCQRRGASTATHTQREVKSKSKSESSQSISLDIIIADARNQRAASF